MRVFINYKRNVHPDQGLAQHLENALRQAGYEVFLDQTGIYSGTQWAQKIQDEIEQCDLLLSLVSNASLQSEWVLNEIDYARKRNKMVLPVLLEKLQDSLEFQEYIPRFRRIQHYLFSGDPARTAHDVIQRLQQGSAILEAPAFSQPGIDYDDDDDSENPGWRQFVADHPALLQSPPDSSRSKDGPAPTASGPAGTITLGLEDAVQLALMRSVYYRRQRSIAQRANEPKLPAAEQAFAAFRQGFYTQVALGEFGISGFARSWNVAASRAARPELRGFLGLVVRRLRCAALEDSIKTLTDLRALCEAYVEGGILSALQTEQVNQALLARQALLLQAAAAFEDAVDHFKIYTLGVPGECALAVDDSLVPRFRFDDEHFTALQREASELTWEMNAAEQQRRPADVGPATARVGAISAQVAALMQSIDQEFDALGSRTGPSAAADDSLIASQSIAESMGQLVDDWLPPDKRRAIRELELAREAQGTPKPPRDLRLLKEAWERTQRELARASTSWAPRELNQRMNDLQMTIAQLQGIRMRIRLQAHPLEPIELALEQAEELAQKQRPDSDLLRTDAALKRAVRQALRRTLRELDLLRNNVRLARQAIGNAMYQADSTRDLLQAPPLPGGTHSVNERMVVNLIDASLRVHDAQDDFGRCWLEHFAARLRLFRDLGALQIDEAGHGSNAGATAPAQ